METLAEKLDRGRLWQRTEAVDDLAVQLERFPAGGEDRPGAREAGDGRRLGIVQHDDVVLGSNGEGEARLADAGRADEGDEAVGAEEAPQIGELLLAADERLGSRQRRAARRRWFTQWVNCPSAITPMKISPTISIPRMTCLPSVAASAMVEA
jgi:hypothetical protein